MLAARPLVKSVLARTFSPAFIRKYSEIVKPVKTRKKKSELPEAAIGTAGESTLPLGEWQGGLKGRSKDCVSVGIGMCIKIKVT